MSDLYDDMPQTAFMFVDGYVPICRHPITGLVFAMNLNDPAVAEMPWFKALKFDLVMGSTVALFFETSGVDQFYRLTPKDQNAADLFIQRINYQLTESEIEQLVTDTANHYQELYAYLDVDDEDDE